MTDSVEIDLPAALWLAKLTPNQEPDELLEDTSGCVPTNWSHGPLATSIGFGGMLSLADVGDVCEPAMSQTGSLPLPGDRIIVTRTGRRVEAFGVVEVTGLTILPNGGVSIGHRPVLYLSEPVDLRAVRNQNHLLNERWDALFGQAGRDRRLIPLVDADVALTFTAMGLSLETLFAPAEPFPRTVDPIEAWQLKDFPERVKIRSCLAQSRMVDGVLVHQGASDALDYDTDLVSVDVSSHNPGRDLLLTMQEPDCVYYSVVQSLELGEKFRMNPAYRQLLQSDEAASTLIAVETDEEWTIVELNPPQSLLLHGASAEQTDVVLRELGFLGQ